MAGAAGLPGHSAGRSGNVAAQVSSTATRSDHIVRRGQPTLQDKGDLWRHKRPKKAAHIVGVCLPVAMQVYSGPSSKLSLHIAARCPVWSYFQTWHMFHGDMPDFFVRLALACATSACMQALC